MIDFSRHKIVLFSISILIFFQKYTIMYMEREITHNKNE